MNQQPFFDIFRTGKQEMEKVIAAGLSAGGDWCDLYFEYSVYNDLMLRDGEVNSGGYHEDFGVGIRVLDGERTGYAYSESTELKDMIAAAKAAWWKKAPSAASFSIPATATRNVISPCGTSPCPDPARAVIPPIWWRNAAATAASRSCAPPRAAAM